MRETRRGKFPLLCQNHGSKTHGLCWVYVQRLMVYTHLKRTHSSRFGHESILLIPDPKPQQTILHKACKALGLFEAPQIQTFYQRWVSLGVGWRLERAR